MSMMFLAPYGLKRGDKVLVCEDYDSLRTCGRICDALGLDVQSVAAHDSGSIDLAGLRNALYADRHGDIRAVFVSRDGAADARDVIDLAWHDAALVVESAVAGAA